MDEKEFKYNAFISYRHNDLDKFVAENLHRLIETYKIPKAVVEKYNITDNNIRRVFRDQDELPIAASLEDPIIEAIKESKFLIVICSPRLKESVWCRKEIENFIKFHGRGNILCVLVEGEPRDSFPDELLHYEVKEKDEAGNEITKTVECEPLAMDVRGNSKKEIYKNLQTELIRIIAPMYNLDYDDIKRRHEERQLQMKVRLFRIVAIVSIIFAIYSGVLFFNIYISSEKLKYDQAISLADSSKELLLKDNRKGAIEKAYQSVTEYNKNKMPITNKGIYELTESLGVYYTSEFNYALTQLDTIGIVQSIKTNLDMNYLLSYDSSRELTLWNLDNEKRVITISDSELTIDENTYTFIGNKAFAYQNKNDEIVIIDLNGNEINRFKFDSEAQNICASETGKYLAVTSKNIIKIYNTDSYEEVSSYKFEENMVIIDGISFDEQEENIVFAIQDRSIGKLTQINNELELVSFNIVGKNIVNQSKINDYEITKMMFNKDNLYVLATKSEGFVSTMNLIYYNYKDGNILFNKEFENEYPLNFNLNNNTVLVSSLGLSHLLDSNSGEEKAKFSISGKITDAYVIINSDNYMLFTNNGEVHIIKGSENDLINNVDNDLIYVDLYHFNLTTYNKFLNTSIGIAAFANNDNRIVIYGKIRNEDIKEIEYEKNKNEIMPNYDFSQVIEEYNFEKKNLVCNMFYSDDKKLLFVCYTDNTIDVYDNESKKLLNTIENIKDINVFVGKTDDNKFVIKGSKGGYILNNKFEVIAYVPQLEDYKDGKIIIESNSKYFEVKIYNENELINKAKEKLYK